MNFHLLGTIAKYEALALQRSWFFRIFAALAIIGLSIFNVVVFIPMSNSPWVYKALGASIPYANIIILNLAQAVVAIFLASEFLKQDQKNDTVEVIYVRSMSNTTYVLGKTLGILMVFLILNFIILILGIGFSFLRSDSTQDVLALFIYPLLISLPTLVFIIGLAFALMVIVKNQAVTFILLLGYIALTVFYLNEKAYHLFDYIAYNVPMMYSSFTGFVDLPEILIHRGVYLLLGTGLIFFTIYKLNRLPQAENRHGWPLATSAFFLLSGILLGVQFLKTKTTKEEFLLQIRELNYHYQGFQNLEFTKCDIEFDHQKDQLHGIARLEIVLKKEQPVDTLLFNLNPSLHIQSIKLQKKETLFVRQLHLIKIPLMYTPTVGEKLEIEIAYNGIINDEIAFVDLDSEEYKENYNLEMFTIRKRSAFLTPAFVSLTPALAWYPRPGAGYTSSRPYEHEVHFTQFTLKVKTSPDLLAVSQGRAEKVGAGEFLFSPEQPLPQLSLIIGPYIKKSAVVDSVEYSIYSKKGNDFYTTHFQETTDSIPGIIRKLADEFQIRLNRTYPYKRFSLVEVPINFATDIHKWAFASDAVQPEMILYHEKGINLHSSDLEIALKREKEQLLMEGKEALAADLQFRLFNTLIRKNFLENNNFHVFPQYYSFSNHFKSNQWPLLNKAIQLYLQDNHNGRHMNLDNRINQKLGEASLTEIMSAPFIDKQAERLKEDILRAKSKYFFEYVKASFNSDRFDPLLREIIDRNKYKSVHFSELEEEVYKKLGFSLGNELNDWHNGKNLPAFLVKDVRVFKVARSEKDQYQVVFKIANVKEANGLINPNLQLDKDRFRDAGIYSVSARSAMEIAIRVSAPPHALHIKTAISKNMPGDIVIDLKDIIPKLIDSPFDATAECAYFSSNRSPNEIIVDNEDDGFKRSNVSQAGFLKEWMGRDKKIERMYAGLNIFNPAKNWSAVLDSRFYGDFIHSAEYIAGGTGENYVEWHASIPEAANYDVYFYSAFFTRGRVWRNQPIDYHLSVFHDGGKDQIRRTDREFERGWNYLGSYYISSDSAKVLLSDKTTGELVIADAVKWVRR